MKAVSRNHHPDSPALFLGISIAYLEASQIIWQAEFSGKAPLQWNIALLFHPLSSLFGIAIETAMKGLLSCRGHDTPRSHDLVDLLERIQTADLRCTINKSIENLCVPDDLIELNRSFDRSDVESAYRGIDFHIDILNKLYDRPFAARYPVLGGHSLPDPMALRPIAQILQRQLQDEINARRGLGQ